VQDRNNAVLEVLQGKPTGNPVARRMGVRLETVIGWKDAARRHRARHPIRHPTGVWTGGRHCCRRGSAPRQGLRHLFSAAQSSKSPRGSTAPPLHGPALRRVRPRGVKRVPNDAFRVEG